MGMNPGYKHTEIGIIPEDWNVKSTFNIVEPTSPISYGLVAGDSMTAPPEEMDAPILFAPVGTLIPEALRHTANGVTVVCAGIHMSEVPAFPYSILWGERCIRSIANLTRRDGEEFFALVPQAGIRTEVETFALEQANEALERLRSGDVHGAAVLVMP